MSGFSDRCTLHHRGFVMLGDVVFQRSETDGVPVALVPLGGRPASIPLDALRRELGIEDDSEDGRMLGMVAEALDYVVGLRPGDKLPAEVLTGEASWEPQHGHIAIARSLLRKAVLAWAREDDAGVDLTPVLGRLAEPVGQADADGVAARIEELAGELAYIEALREGLLRRVQMLSFRLKALAKGSSQAVRFDALVQSRRLVTTALSRLTDRFAEVEAQTGEIVPALRNLDAQRTFIRSNRDWLHRSRLAWEKLLRRWESVPEAATEAAWELLPETYHFLAPRFMSTQEWRSSEKKREKPKQHAVLTW